MTENPSRTPVRDALIDSSDLAEHVQDGLGAVKDRDKSFIEVSIRAKFTDSLDTDAAFRAGRDQDPRWDYLLGHENRQLIAIEPHSAKTDEINAVINKKRAVLLQLQGHLKENKSISRWLWVASGRVAFPKDSQFQRRLSQHGITFVGSCVMEKHLR
jgi:hypothetical protein